MKKLFSMMALLAALVMSVSCTKDGDLSNGDLVGTWEVVEIYEKATVYGEVVEGRYYYEPGEFFVVFKKDGRLQIGSDGEVYDESITYKVNGEKLVLIDTSGTEDEYEQYYDIKKLDSRELVLTQSYSETGYSYYMEIVFRKNKNV